MNGMHWLLSLMVLAGMWGPGVEPQQPAPARETYAVMSGQGIWFKDTGGAGVPIVLLHAATGSVRNWENQFTAFSAAGYRVIAYDRKGWGRTVSQPGDDVGNVTDDLESLVEYLGVDRFHLLGTAAGVSVALDYAMEFPQRLRSLVIANGVGGMQDEDYLELGRTLRPPQFDALPAHIRELGPSYRASNPDGTRAWMELERMSRQDGAAAPQFRNRRMTFAQLERIKTPTLLITGDADMYAPPPLLRRFTERIRNSQSVVIPEAGHSSYWERPDVFNRAVLDFVRKY
jgi:pimeloyl-ACP methyl ester carboxylesterase